MNIKTIQRPFSSEFKSSNSRFLGVLMPFQNKESLKFILEELRRAHPKANHICYAYRIGFDNEEIRANDDGEPSGSAGKPILNQLYSHGVKNCILFVIRYFGGTKLGIPGLIEAYKEAASLCLQSAEYIEQTETKTVEISVETSQYYTLVKLLKTNKIEVINSSYSQLGYQLSILIPVSQMNLIAPYL
jgi:uncharacterized YigZ family protein